MSEVLRGLGKETKVQVTKTQFEVQICEISGGELVLETGDRVLARGYASGHVGTSWLVCLSINWENDFYVTDKENAVDALEDIGRFYLAVKAGEV